jgi:DNA-binding transcriptional LysR family regulator
MLHELRFAELTGEELCLAVAPKHRLARKRSVTLEQAVQEPFIGYSRTDYPEYCDLLVESFASTKTKPRVNEEHDSLSSLIAAVETGNGVALAPASLACTAGRRLKLLPLTPALPPLVIGAAWSRRGLPLQAERFLELARKAPESTSPS